jgi:hypothetical protein
MNKPLWRIPYVDQPIDFWHEIDARFGEHIREVYLPIPDDTIGTGRPRLPSDHLLEFLRAAPFELNVLINPILFKQPVETVGPNAVRILKQLLDEYRIASVTVSNLLLAEIIKKELPDLQLTASVLMDISTPYQARLLNGLFDALVPATRIMRDVEALGRLRKAFQGRICLMVNEGCLPGCPHRTQHFYDMCNTPFSGQPCMGLLNKEPWLRLTGGWVLPQHLRFYDGLYDELKLSGRNDLQRREDYFRVLGAYVERKPLAANQIGVGPAGMLIQSAGIEDAFFEKTLHCSHDCTGCRICRDYFETHISK